MTCDFIDLCTISVHSVKEKSDISSECKETVRPFTTTISHRVRMLNDAAKQHHLHTHRILLLQRSRPHEMCRNMTSFTMIASAELSHATLAAAVRAVTHSLIGSCPPLSSTTFGASVSPPRFRPRIRMKTQLGAARIKMKIR